MNDGSTVGDFQTDTYNSRINEHTIRNPAILGMTLPFSFAGPGKLSLDRVLKTEICRIACYPAFHPGPGDTGLTGWRLRAARI